MSRKLDDWLTSYVEYASFSEAPKKMHFWVGVSAIAGALRRRVWLDMAYFKWYCNFYVIIVAPPGIIAKSTTSDIGMNLLRKVPGINFGPDVVTWQALVKAFSECSESYKVGEDYHTMCAFTLTSSEFGNLLNPSDREMVDLLVTLWDSRQGGFSKVTKMSGSDMIENPWINIIACTTPSWIAGNFPEYIIGGGFTSRCVFVYGDTKDKLVAYPHLAVPADLNQRRDLLVQDLEHIATKLLGAYTLSPSAIEWGQSWYEHHYKNRPPELDDDRFGGYIARKQTHIHKLAMIIAASARDEQVITEGDLAIANTMVTDLEKDMPKVFAKIGKSQESVHVDRFINHCRKVGTISYAAAYRYLHSHFPAGTSSSDILTGAINSGYLKLVNDAQGMRLESIQDVG